MTLRLEYGHNIKYHKVFYGKSGLMNYVNSNYAFDIKNK